MMNKKTILKILIPKNIKIIIIYQILKIIAIIVIQIYSITMPNNKINKIIYNHP